MSGLLVELPEGASLACLAGASRVAFAAAGHATFTNQGLIQETVVAALDAGSRIVVFGADRNATT